MPELPEVEAARKLAHEHCAGKKIIKVVCEDDETVIQVRSHSYPGPFSLKVPIKACRRVVPPPNIHEAGNAALLLLLLIDGCESSICLHSQQNCFHLAFHNPMFPVRLLTPFGLNCSGEALTVCMTFYSFHHILSQACNANQEQSSSHLIGLAWLVLCSVVPSHLHSLYIYSLLMLQYIVAEMHFLSCLFHLDFLAD